MGDLATPIYQLPESAGMPNVVYVDPGQPCPKGMVLSPEQPLCFVSPCPLACISGEPFDLSGKAPADVTPPVSGATKGLLGAGAILLLVGLIYAAAQVRRGGR